MRIGGCSWLETSIAVAAVVLLLGCGDDSTSGAGGFGGGVIDGATTSTHASGASVSQASGAQGSTAVASASSGGNGEPAALAGITAAHNEARASVVPAANPAIPPLSWSPTVAATAQAYADNCVFEHSGGQYGENLFATSGSASPDDVVSSWVSEANDYDYEQNSCSDVCGHYTQVVWRDSANIGCGVANCTRNSPFGGGSWQLWVCNYDPPGNFNGQQPY